MNTPAATSGRIIRRLAAEDLDTAMALVRDVFMQFEAPGYSRRGIAEFMDFISPVFMRSMMDSGEILLWGCYLDGHIAGVAALRPPGHVSLLFVGADYHRRGIARQLTDCMVQSAAEAGCSRITVHAAPYALRAYRRMGFVESGPERVENGLRFIPMTRPV